MLRVCLPPLPPFLFAALVVSGLASKALHIALHIRSLPFVYFILFSPTLVLPDLVVIAVTRLLLQFSSPETRLQWISTYIGGFLSLITWGASSIQFGFFMQTGAEVAWAASNSFLSDPAAMKILLSGITTVSAAATALGLVAFLVHSRLYNFTGLGLQAIRDLCVGSLEARHSIPTFSSKAWVASANPQSLRRITVAAAACVSLLFLELVRPSVPYDHLSGALPLTLLDAFRKTSATVDSCSVAANPFPFGLPPGFQTNSSVADPWSRPAWLPQNPPAGFSRWHLSPEERLRKDNTSACGNPQGKLFDPKNDPLKISNLGGEVLEPLQKAFKDHSVHVDHVVLLTLESGRKEVFPMQQGNYMFDALLDSHRKYKQDQAIDELVRLTPVAQMLTGERATDSKGQQVNLSHAQWQDSAKEGMGGINIRGAVTGSSLTFKSLLGSHCGVHPLPVDMLEESGLEIYQPCLPQIFKLFNEVKSQANSTNTSTNALNYPWKPVFMQSITDDFDRQNILNDHMGFEETVVRNNLRSLYGKYRAQGDEVNYFGYAETELRPYLRDLFDEAAKNKTRMFLSHITSTTHHPWGTPDDFPEEQYLGNQGDVRHTQMNDYLNTVRFVDGWLGEVMSMLDEAGIANKTLVVFVGDHGQAFAEDDEAVTGTYENGHISNFRVPLVFRHPQLPRIDIAANATSISIIPTILDLLVQTQSLDERDSEIASALLPTYQGQSLIRPFVPAVERHPMEQNYTNAAIHARYSPEEGPRVQPVWNFGLINAGGSMLSVTTANDPYRLVLPIKDGFEYTFSHLLDDPGERKRMKAWTLKDLIKSVKPKYGDEAAAWLQDAEQLGKWWVVEQRRIWGYQES
ncbi:hypothetical protein NUU61_005344 [Penicillium alfredii]|uniref:Sulfatase N-terminal domain-containing protein n=1 Tax=Penicillium alfredii TaxID=1506179 RepID=A0A9W9F986_9EURO|nr:uncharacterized protein NUU61_005344 [Penicillium alfredii]KAJ5095988.1 hypothetical protein NUU61_005344 [Penicillium alfredii]